MCVCVCECVCGWVCACMCVSGCECVCVRVCMCVCGNVCGCECVNSSLISRTIGGHGDNCCTLRSLLDQYVPLIERTFFGISLLPHSSVPRPAQFSIWEKINNFWENHDDFLSSPFESTKDE